MTAGGARAKATGKPRRRRIDAARRAGPANHGAAGSGHAQGLFARSYCSIACSALALANALLAKPTGTVALANSAIAIAATVVSQSAAAVALAATAVALAATTIALALAATAYATLSLAATVAAVAFAFAFAFAAAAQPAQSAYAALATVEGHAAPLKSHSIAPHRDGSIGVRNAVVFS